MKGNKKSGKGGGRRKKLFKKKSKSKGVHKKDSTTCGFIKIKKKAREKCTKKRNDNPAGRPEYARSREK